MNEPYQLVPSETKLMMSKRLAVVVMVGAVPPLHFTEVNVEVNPPAPDLRNRVKLLPAVAVGIVNVQLPVRVAVCTVPLVSAMV